MGREEMGGERPETPLASVKFKAFIHDTLKQPGKDRRCLVAHCSVHRVQHQDWSLPKGWRNERQVRTVGGSELMQVHLRMRLKLVTVHKTGHLSKHHRRVKAAEAYRSISGSLQVVLVDEIETLSIGTTSTPSGVEVARL